MHPDYTNFHVQNLGVRNERQHCILGNAHMGTETGLGQGTRFLIQDKSRGQREVTRLKRLSSVVESLQIHYSGKAADQMTIQDMVKLMIFNQNRRQERCQVTVEWQDNI